MTQATRAATLVAVAALGLAAGCSSKGQQLRANIAEFNAERTPDKLVTRAKAFAVVGDTTRAEQYYAAALEAGAPDTLVTPLLVEVCVRDGRYRAAIEYAAPYLRRHPTDVAMRYALGTLYQGTGDVRGAREQLESVVGKRPDQPDPHYALGILLRDDVSDLVAADDQFREYLRLAPMGVHAEEARASLMRAAR